MSQIPNITIDCGTNPAGMTALYAVRTKHVETMPKAVAGIIIDDIVLQAPITWTLIAYIPESLGFSEVEKAGDNGSMFTQSLTWQVKEDRPEIVAILDDLRQAELVFVTVDQHGRQRVIGHPDAPARMVTTVKVDARSGGLNGYESTVTAVSARRAPHYTGDLFSYIPLAFHIDSVGNLIYTNPGGVATGATVNGSGELVISGINASNYGISGTEASYTP